MSLARSEANNTCRVGGTSYLNQAYHYIIIDSVMDDIIGWCAMFVTGTCHPWSGFTVQVNTSLRRPIPVGKFLLARATITKVERRKVFIEAVLMDPENGNDIVHAEGDGLVVMNKGILPNH